MDLQTVLIVILVILTINLIGVGIYVILILKEFRETVRKANHVLDNVGDVTDVVVNPITSLAGVITGVTQSVNAVKAISSLFDKKEKEE